MTGYVRVDTSNNIADGNVIAAADLDNEFNGVQAAFNTSTGHAHGGDVGEGAPITKLGPTNDVTISSTLLAPKTNNTVDIGTTSLRYKDLYLAGNALITGTLGVTGASSFTSITASGAITGNGNWTIGNADTDTITQSASYVSDTVLRSAKLATNTLSLAAYDVDGAAYTNLITLTAANAPTLALTSTGVGTINNMSVGATTASTGAFTTLSANSTVTFTGLSASQAVFTDASDNLVSNAITGTGNVVMSTSPTLVTPVLGAATATSINKIVFTAPANSATLTIADGTTITLPPATTTVAGLGTTQTFTGVNTFTPAARTSGTASYFTVTTPADTSLTASTESIGSNFTAATRSWIGGTLALQRERVFAAPTYSFATTSTLTTAVNVDIALPVAGTNATFTNVYALRAAASQFTGTLNLNNLTASTALALDANKNVVSVTNTGTGSNVLSESPTLTGTVGVAALTATGTVTFTGLTASQAVFTDASDNLVSNAITGTGNVVMSASPTLTGTITASAITASGTVTGNGNWVIGNADTDTITQGAAYVTGTQLRSAKLATNTLALAAYDVDGAAYTNLITLTAANAPTLALTSTGVGTINNMSIGATTASTGAFTTLSATGVSTFQAGTAAAPAITTTGDTNTGIFFPAADTIAFSEGGVESMRLDSSGNLGIGTSSPLTALDVASAAGSPIISLTASGAWRYQILTDRSTQTFRIRDQSAGNLDRVIIDSSGNLGLGITPSAWSGTNTKALDISLWTSLANGNAFGSAFTFNGFYNGTNWIYKQTNTTSKYEQDGSHRWYTAPSGTAGNTISFTQAMTLDASGNLLVGTTQAGSPGLGVSNSTNISFPESSANTSFATMFRQASSADLVLGSGVRYSSATNGYASSTGSAWARTAINVGYGAIKFFTAAEATVAVGTDTTLTERARIDTSGNFIQSAPSTAPSLTTNGQMVFNLTSNTNLRVSVRGSDGVTRTANITLA